MQKPLAAAALFPTLLFPLTARAQEPAPVETDHATHVSPRDKQQLQVVDIHAALRVGEAQGKTEHARQFFMSVASQQTPRVDGRYLGVACMPLGIEEGEALGLPRGTGLRIQKVQDQSPGYAAGLRNGDVLVRLNEQLLVNNPQVTALIRSFDVDETVTLHLIRSGKKQSVQATLGTRKIPQIGPGGHIPNESWQVQPKEGQSKGGLSLGVGPVANTAGGQTALPTQRIVVDLAQPQSSKSHGKRPLIEIDLGRMLKLKHNHGIRYTTMTWKSGDQKVTTTVLNEGKAIKSIDQDGQVLYEGPVQADGNYPGLPDQVQTMLKDRTKDGKLHIGSSAVRFKNPKPAENAKPTEANPTEAKTAE